MSSRALLTSGAVLLQMLLSFLFDKFFALFCSSRTYKWSQIFCLWSCTLEQILAYPINNFLISSYHSKLLRAMLNTFCSNRMCFFADATGGKPNFSYMTGVKSLLIHKFLHSQMHRGSKTKESLNYKGESPNFFLTRVNQMSPIWQGVKAY